MSCIKILVIEDLSGNRDALVQGIKQELHEQLIELKDSPSRGHIPLAASYFDIVVCDVNLSQSGERPFEGLFLFADAWRDSLRGEAMPEIILYTGYTDAHAAYEPFIKGDELPLCVFPKTDTGRVQDTEKSALVELVLRRLRKIRRRLIDGGVDLTPLRNAIVRADSMESLKAALSITFDVGPRGKMTAGELFPDVGRKISKWPEARWQEVQADWQYHCVDDAKLFRFYRLFRGERPLASKPFAIGPRLSCTTHPNGQCQDESLILRFTHYDCQSSPQQVEEFLNIATADLPEVAKKIKDYFTEHCYDEIQKVYRRMKPNWEEENSFKEAFSFDPVEAVKIMKDTVDRHHGKPVLGKIEKILDELLGADRILMRKKHGIPLLVFAEKEKIMKALTMLAQQAVTDAYTKNQTPKEVFLDLHHEADMGTGIATLVFTIADYGKGIADPGIALHKGEATSMRGRHYKDVRDGLKGYCQFLVETVVQGSLYTHNLWSYQTVGPLPVTEECNDNLKQGTRLTLTFRCPLYLG
jgi:hypothetical protein